MVIHVVPLPARVLFFSKRDPGPGRAGHAAAHNFERRTMDEREVRRLRISRLHAGGARFEVPVGQHTLRQ